MFNIGIAIGISTFFIFHPAFAALIIFGWPTPAVCWLNGSGIVGHHHLLFPAGLCFLNRINGRYKFPGLQSYHACVRPNTLGSWRSHYHRAGFHHRHLFIQQNFRRQLYRPAKLEPHFPYLLVALFIPFINATYVRILDIVCRTLSFFRRSLPVSGKALVPVAASPVDGGLCDCDLLPVTHRHTFHYLCGQRSTLISNLPNEIRRSGFPGGNLRGDMIEALRTTW